ALAATANSAQPYWMRWSFRADGGRLKQERWTAGSTAVEKTDYQYANPAKPHQMTRAESSVNASDVSLGYGPDGAVTSRTVANAATPQTFTYDSDGSLKSVTGSGGTSSYVQDAAGN